MHYQRSVTVQDVLSIQYTVDSTECPTLNTVRKKKIQPCVISKQKETNCGLLYHLHKRVCVCVCVSTVHTCEYNILIQRLNYMINF